MKYKIRLIKIFTCEECPCLGADNRCDEIEDYIDHEIAVSGPIPKNCPLEEREYDA